ncbi:MAG: Diphthamide biosynthesis protein 4 [Trizodia sp. TS-e1964]|nr:MAG: Diphthamide biosynthesis protein 4 [Trizodia sp. TS-e1964]
MEYTLPPDPYKALGLSKGASLNEIKVAHRKLVLQCHPDKVQDESKRAAKVEQFQQVQQAYELLVDDTKRQQYEEHLKRAELKKEIYEGRARAAPTRFEVRTAEPPPSFQSASSRVYEHRRPSRSFEDDIASSSRYREEQRSSSRKFDGYDRHSSRTQDEAKRSRASEPPRERERERERDKDHERAVHSERRKARDKDRRKGYQDKYEAPGIYEDGDSDLDRYRTRSFEKARPSAEASSSSASRRAAAAAAADEEKNRRIEASIRARNEQARRVNEEVDHVTRKTFEALSYMQGRASSLHPHIEDAPPRRHGPYRSSTSDAVYESRSKVPPPSPPSPPLVVDDGPRRSSARRSTPREHDHSRSRPERKGSSSSFVLDPLATSSEQRKERQGSHSSPAVHLSPLPGHSSAPRRAETFQFTRRGSEGPHIQRASTLPISPLAAGISRSREHPASKLRTHVEPERDSGYSSPGTPDTPTRFASSQYIFVGSDIEHSESYPPRTHRATSLRDMVEELGYEPKIRHASERPSAPRGTPSARRSASHSRSYIYSNLEPVASRSPPMSGERAHHSSRPQSYDVSSQHFENVKYSPRFRREDVSYTESRRSAEPAGYHDKPLYSQPYHFDMQPNMRRAETYTC